MRGAGAAPVIKSVARNSNNALEISLNMILAAVAKKPVSIYGVGISSNHVHLKFGNHK